MSEECAEREQSSIHLLIGSTQSGKVNLWSTMKKQKLKTWKTSGKVWYRWKEQKRSWSSRRTGLSSLMMVFKSRPEVDIKEVVRLRVSVVPKSVFVADSTVLYCSSKIALMHIWRNCQRATPLAALLRWNGRSPVLRQARLDKELLASRTTLQQSPLQQVWWQPGNPASLSPMWYAIIPEICYTKTKARI